MLVIWHLLIAFLIGTFLWAPTRFLWERLDTAFFQLFNGSLRGRPNWQLFWAFANHRLADWIEDICILAFFVVSVLRSPKEMRLRKISAFIFSAIAIALIIYFVNRMLFRSYVHIPRDSPTLTFDTSVRLSQEIPWMRIKDGSPKSFPGDHATTALIFASSFFYFAGWRQGLVAIFYAAFLCLPRLVTGAHWLSDVLIGSGSIALFFMSWLLCTPIHTRCIEKIEKGLRLLLGLIKKKKNQQEGC